MLNWFGSFHHYIFISTSLFLEFICSFVLVFNFLKGLVSLFCYYLRICFGCVHVCMYFVLYYKKTLSSLVLITNKESFISFDNKEKGFIIWVQIYYLDHYDNCYSTANSCMKKILKYVDSIANIYTCPVPQNIWWSKYPEQYKRYCLQRYSLWQLT